uniref:Secreted protein n=1 Tax=Opuntia streptacantha TaxID=393608 RepID=A0A7C9ALT7_OPUST
MGRLMMLLIGLMVSNCGKIARKSTSPCGLKVEVTVIWSFFQNILNISRSSSQLLRNHNKLEADLVLVQIGLIILEAAQTAGIVNQGPVLTRGRCLEQVQSRKKKPENPQNREINRG